MYDNLNIYITPPQETAAETEEDSDKSDDKHEAIINHLSRGILQQDCEVTYKNNDDNFDEEDLIPLSYLRTAKENPERKEKLLINRWFSKFI